MKAFVFATPTRTTPDSASGEKNQKHHLALLTTQQHLAQAQRPTCCAVLDGTKRCSLVVSQQAPPTRLSKGPPFGPHRLVHLYRDNLLPLHTSYAPTNLRGQRPRQGSTRTTCHGLQRRRFAASCCLRGPAAVLVPKPFSQTLLHFVSCLVVLVPLYLCIRPPNLSLSTLHCFCACASFRLRFSQPLRPCTHQPHQRACRPDTTPPDAEYIDEAPKDCLLGLPACRCSREKCPGRFQFDLLRISYVTTISGLIFETSLPVPPLHIHAGENTCN